MEISLSSRTFGYARIVLNVRDSLKLAPVLRVKHLESESVRVDEDGKVVPRILVKRRLEKHALIVRADANHFCVAFRQCRIEWGPLCGASGQSNAEKRVSRGERIVPIWASKTCDPSFGSMNTTWYSCVTFNGCDWSAWMEK